MKEITRTRYFEAFVAIKQGTQVIRLAFERKDDYEAFSMAFNEAYGDGPDALLEAEFHAFEAPVSALPEED